MINKHRTSKALRSLTAFAAGAVLATSVGSGAASASSSQSVTLLTWVNPPTIKAFKKIDAEFHKKYPNITVNLRTAADVSGPYATMLQTAVNGNTADIVTEAGPFNPLPKHASRANESLWQYWSTHGVFLALNKEPWIKRYQAGARKLETYKGKTYGVVTGSYQEGVFYNKADFAKYHLQVPQTYKQFLAVCKTLKAHHVTPLFDALGGVGGGYLQFIYEPLMQELWATKIPGGNLATALETGKAKWTSPAFTKVMNEEKAIAKYLEPNFTGVPWESMPGAFAKNDAAMLLDGSWDVPTVHSTVAKVKVGFFPLPGSNDIKVNQPLLTPNLTLSVMKSAPDMSGALKWMKFFSTSKIYRQYVEFSGTSTSQVSGKFGGFTANALGNWFGKGVSASEILPTLPVTGSYWDQATNWPTMQLDVVQGKKTPKQAQQAYQAGWNG